MSAFGVSARASLAITLCRSSTIDRSCRKSAGRLRVIVSTSCSCSLSCVTVAVPARPSSTSCLRRCSSAISSSMRRACAIRSGLVMSARRRTACAMLPSLAPETVLSPSAISRTNRSARNEYGERR